MPLRSVCVAALLLASCTPYDRPTMNPGEDCMDCHRKGGEADSLRWTVAGTVYPALGAGAGEGVAGVHVLLMDALGKKVVLTSNRAGNFYTLEPFDLEHGVQAIIEYQGQCRGMRFRGGVGVAFADGGSDDAPLYSTTPSYTYGTAVPTLHPATLGVGCNHCHNVPPNPNPNDAPTDAGPYGRITIPQFYGDDGGNEPCPPELSNLR